MSNLDEFRASKINTWPILVLRVYTGLYFLWFGFGKITRDNFDIEGFVTGRLEDSFSFWQPVLESVVLPAKGFFAFLVAWGEFAIGLAMIIGFMTRYAAIAGAVMVTAFWFTKGQPLTAAGNFDFMWLVIFVVLAGLHAGRTMSVDARLASRYKFLA